MQETIDKFAERKHHPADCTCSACIELRHPIKKGDHLIHFKPIEGEKVTKGSSLRIWLPVLAITLMIVAVGAYLWLKH